MDVESCQMLFCVYWDYMIFVLDFVNVVYHIYWFADVETSLHLGNKFHTITVYAVFKVLLNLVCCFLLRIFAFISIIYWPVFSFLVVSLCGFGIRVMLTMWNEFGSVHYSVFFGKVWEGLVLILFFLVEFTSEAVWS